MNSLAGNLLFVICTANNCHDLRDLYLYYCTTCFLKHNQNIQKGYKNLKNRTIFISDEDHDDV